MDAKDVRAMQQAILRRSHVADHRARGGRVEKYIGDAVLASSACRRRARMTPSALSRAAWTMHARWRRCP